MASKEEKEYYAYLEKMIRQRKGLSPFFSVGTEDYEMDVMTLAEHIARKNPKLAARLAGSVVDATGMKDASRQDILSFMARTEKGTIVKWLGPTGEALWLVNDGSKNPLRLKKSVRVFGERLTKSDLMLLRKSVCGAVLKRDIKRVYRKIARDEERAKKSGPVRNVLSAFEAKATAEKVRGASKFERDFKELCRRAGGSASPYATAQALVMGMSDGEKKALIRSMKMQGVKSPQSFLGLLAQWKAEALNPRIVVERKRARERDVEVSRGR